MLYVFIIAYALKKHRVSGIRLLGGEIHIVKLQIVNIAGEKSVNGCFLTVGKGLRILLAYLIQLDASIGLGSAARSDNLNDRKINIFNRAFGQAMIRQGSGMGRLVRFFS